MSANIYGQQSINPPPPQPYILFELFWSSMLSKSWISITSHSTIWLQEVQAFTIVVLCVVNRIILCILLLYHTFHQQGESEYLDVAMLYGKDKMYE
jgi:hypothetical protein